MYCLHFQEVILGRSKFGQCINTVFVFSVAKSLKSVHQIMSGQSLERPFHREDTHSLDRWLRSRRRRSTDGGSAAPRTSRCRGRSIRTGCSRGWRPCSDPRSCRPPCSRPWCLPGRGDVNLALPFTLKFLGSPCYHCMTWAWPSPSLDLAEAHVRC